MIRYQVHFQDGRHDGVQASVSSVLHETEREAIEYAERLQKFRGCYLVQVFKVQLVWERCNDVL